ncbi:uncharacterized protein LOC129221217 [Uloborus diversus]|uniref:uncharacterized protein LOC129221217 n=1 Tax=Uloborus diversus TaxID=327109 RepID=UPI002409326D|nr:uncharacterized protein LOC129221217 [Uloborus diversus]
MSLKLFSGRLDFNSSLTDETSDDISGKEKDYSLSEGEVHPKFLEQEESDISDTSKDENKHKNFQSQKTRMPSHHLSYSPLSEIGLGSTNTSLSQGEVSLSKNKHRNFQPQETRMPSPQLSYSSMSEIELSSTNTSLSQGEVSPSNEINYYSKKALNLPIIKSPVDDKLSTVLSYAKSFMQIDEHKAYMDTKTFKRSEGLENEHCRKDTTSVPSTSRTVLQTVEEEVLSNASFST